jgi:hypothetical protein
MGLGPQGGMDAFEFRSYNVFIFPCVGWVCVPLVSTRFEGIPKRFLRSTSQPMRHVVNTGVRNVEHAQETHHATMFVTVVFYMETNAFHRILL